MNKRQYVWLPRPLWEALWRAGFLPASSQRGRNVKVAANEKKAAELRRLVRQYKASLHRVASEVADSLLDVA
jgi:hypothetical protein